VRADYERALGRVPVVVHSDPPGADIALRMTGVADARFERQGTTDATSGELRLSLAAGEYEVLVERAGLGFGEYRMSVQAGVAELRVDTQVRATSSTRQGMVRIPGGTYWIGRDIPPGESDSMSLERHQVTLDSFWIDRCEVSNDDYAAFVAATGRAAPKHWTNGSIPSGQERFPVIWVNWADAADYAAWAGKRLPTEAEWEVAARGTDERLYTWGNEYDPTKANLPDPAETRPVGNVTPIKGSLVAVDSPTEDCSPWGVLHLVGNAEEWVAEFWSPAARGPQRHPALLPSQKLTRGASYASATERFALCSYRGALDPWSMRMLTGFRCAKSDVSSATGR
jgi:formylglycine-generating enzyme required for sulfatase activity